MGALQLSWGVLKDSYRDTWNREPPSWYTEGPGVAETPQETPQTQYANYARNQAEQGKTPAFSQEPSRFQQAVRRIPSLSDVSSAGRGAKGALGAAFENLRGKRGEPAVTPDEWHAWRRWRKTPLFGSSWDRNDDTLRPPTDSRGKGKIGQFRENIDERFRLGAQEKTARTATAEQGGADWSGEDEDRLRRIGGPFPIHQE